MHRLVIKPHALKMIRQAYDWYEEQRKGLGEELLSTLDQTYEQIATHPEYYGIAAGQYRQKRLPRFPYVVVYEWLDDEVVVFAVFHISRNPAQKFE